MINNFINEKELNEKASLVDLLARLGFRPVKQKGSDHIFFNMLDDPGLKPSFSVNDELGVWFDHGSRTGGNIMDFALAYWKPSLPEEVIDKINKLYAVSPLTRPLRPRIPVKIPRYIVEEIKDLGTHPAITKYLKSRGIFEAAQDCLYEVYYYITDQKGTKKHFYAAGWQNQSGGWEVRTRLFKACFGYKALTFLDMDKKSLAVFESFTDYLSWRTKNLNSARSILVLNDLSLMQKAISLAKEFSDIDLFFDRDSSGHEASREFLAKLPYATDRSNLYAGFNDYNNWHVAMLKKPKGPFFRINVKNF